MRVVLVRPAPAYVDHILHQNWYGLMAYDLFANRYPPNGLLQLAAVLERAGHEVRVVDCEQKFYTPAAAAWSLHGFRPDLLGVSIFGFNPPADLAFAGELKERLGAPALVVTGHFPRVFPHEAMTRPFVDVALTGKGFVAVPAVAAALQSRAGFDGVPGICFRRGAEVIRTPDEPFTRLDDIPPAARHLVDHRFYTSGLARRRYLTTILGSIGCAYRCYHCIDNVAPYDVRSLPGLVDEIRDAQACLGINEFIFLDPAFNLSRDRVMEFCRRLLDGGIDVTWAVKARADRVDPEMLATMKRAGCVRMGYGIESGDQDQLDRLGRKERIEDIRRGVWDTFNAGIPTVGYFMVGCYDDTPESLQKTLDLALELPFDNIMISTTTPLPGSRLHMDVIDAIGGDPWLPVARGEPYDPEIMKPPRTRLTAAQLGEFKAKIYRAFYGRPSFLSRAFVTRRAHWRYVARGLGNIALNTGALAESVRARLGAAARDRRKRFS